MFVVVGEVVVGWCVEIIWRMGSVLGGLGEGGTDVSNDGTRAVSCSEVKCSTVVLYSTAVGELVIRLCARVWVWVWDTGIYLNATGIAVQGYCRTSCTTICTKTRRTSRFLLGSAPSALQLSS